MKWQIVNFCKKFCNFRNKCRSRQSILYETVRNGGYLMFLFRRSGFHPPPSGPWPPSFTRFLDHTQRRTTIGKIPLDKWSASRCELYLTTHDTHDRHASGGIRTHNLSRRATADPSLSPCGHWDRQGILGRFHIRRYTAVTMAYILFTS